MVVEQVAVHDKEIDVITKYTFGQDIQIYVSRNEVTASVFYGDLEFEVRANKFVMETINKMYMAQNEVERIFLLQVLKSLSF